MKPYYSLNGSALYQGHILDVLPALQAASVHCIVTSPPYWGLRDYGLAPLEWSAVSYAPMAGLPGIEIPGCAEGCEHVWWEEQVVSTGRRDVGREDAPGGLGYVGDDYAGNKQASQGQYCQLCGGWRGCLGLEPTVEMFVGHIVLIWRALWRVLRDDGVCWLNFGDSYTSGMFVHGYLRNVRRGSQWHTFGDYRTDGGQGKRDIGNIETAGKAEAKGLKPKDLIGIPWRVAFALQADGWYLRSDIIWAKGISFCPTYSGSCMPESVRDRPTKGHEYVFLLSKNKRYFYDGDAVREQTGSAMSWAEYESKTAPGTTWPSGGLTKNAGSHKKDGGQSHPAGRNLRTVWTINPGSYAGAHFATFPPVLVEPMILAGTSAKGCCPECGSPWVRVTEKSLANRDGWGPSNPDHSTPQGTHGPSTRGEGRCGDPSVTTTGWRPTCECDAGDPQPCTVLDPFLGSGTTADVARQLRRRWAGVELNKAYCDEHIIPRLSEPLFEWAEQEREAEPEIEQAELFTL